MLIAACRNAGITHVINLSGKGPKASQEEGAVEPEGGWPVEPEWPNPAEEQFQEGENYLHICRVRLSGPAAALSQWGRILMRLPACCNRRAR